MTRDDDTLAQIPWMDHLVHDLRGPLAPLQTASYLLHRPDLEPERREELATIVDRQTRRMGDMLDELGDWIRALQHRLLGNTEPCEPALLLEYAITGGGFDDVAVSDDGSVATVQGDARRLTQMLQAMLGFLQATSPTLAVRVSSNAGQVQVDARETARDPAAKAPPDPAMLFAKPQADAYDEGLGLRLLLAREIARAHGGELLASTVDGMMQLSARLPAMPPA